jgi:periplasmic protein TonB
MRKTLEPLQALYLQLPAAARCAMIVETSLQPPAMSDTATTNNPFGAPVGPVSMEGDAAASRPGLFSGQYAVTGPDTIQAVWERAGFSILTHLIALLLLLAFLKYAPAGSMLSKAMDQIPLHDIVWLNQPGPGGGGGGGGNRMQAPPRKAELPGKDKITVPVTKPEPMVVPQMKPTDTPPPPSFDIPAKTTADSNFTVPGSIDGLGSALSQGPGSGGGYGTGTGTGMGPGTGSGLGPGSGGGTGGGVYRPGSGVTDPTVLREVKPQYTPDAMRAKIQGSVILECVVLADGTVGQVSIIKSLDPVFGLDQEAIKAAKQWRFVPGKRLGQPVNVLVSIELTFTVR